jgi:hypothetical protein
MLHQAAYNAADRQAKKQLKKGIHSESSFFYAFFSVACTLPSVRRSVGKGDILPDKLFLTFLYKASKGVFLPVHWRGKSARRSNVAGHQ